MDSSFRFSAEDDDEELPATTTVLRRHRACVQTCAGGAVLSHVRVDGGEASVDVRKPDSARPRRAAGGRTAGARTEARMQGEGRKREMSPRRSNSP